MNVLVEHMDILKYVDPLALDVKDDESKKDRLIKAILTQQNERYPIKPPFGTIDFINSIIFSKSNYPFSIIGAPGTGKSTLLSLLFLRCIELYADRGLFLVDTHYYDKYPIRSAKSELNEYLHGIDEIIRDNAQQNVIFIDGINRYTRGSRVLEDIISKQVSDWKDKDNVKFVLSIGEMDESMFPPFIRTKQSNPILKHSENRIHLEPVRNNTKQFTSIVKSSLEYYDEKYLEEGKDEKNLRLVNLCQYCKKIGNTRTDFRTIHFILKQQNGENLQKFYQKSIGGMFNDYFHTINDEKTMRGTAKCVLRRPVATSAFASGHPALPVAGVNQPLFVQS